MVLFCVVVSVVCVCCCISGVVEPEAVLSVVVMSVVVLSVVVVSAVVLSRVCGASGYTFCCGGLRWGFPGVVVLSVIKNIQIFTKLCLACLKYKMQLIALNKKQKYKQQ